MRITVVCVGKIKEKFYTQAVEEYSKRLSRYCKLDIVELPDEKTPDNASDIDRKSTRLNSSHTRPSRMPSSA